MVRPGFTLSGPDGEVTPRHTAFSVEPVSTSQRSESSPLAPSSETRSLQGADDVRWGSQPEFEVAILDALQSQPQGVLVSQAAHGAIGSSPYVFARLARFLGRILATGVPAEDAEVWRLFDQVWSDPSLRQAQCETHSTAADREQ
jgi:hypothetical protein